MEDARGLPSLLTTNLFLSPLFPTTTMNEKAFLVVWGQQGVRTRRLHVSPGCNPHWQWRNPFVWRWLNGSFTMRRQNEVSGLIGEKKKMHMETESQESRSNSRAIAVRKTAWRKTFSLKNLDFLPHIFILSQRRSGKLEWTKHVLLSLFLYDICLLTRNTRLSNPTFSVPQYRTDNKAKLQKNMFKIHGFKQHLQLLDSDWPISQVKVDLLEILL